MNFENINQEFQATSASECAVVPLTIDGNFTAHNLQDAAVDMTVPAATKPARQRRGTNGAYDTCWTRHHCLCSLAVIGDNLRKAEIEDGSAVTGLQNKLSGERLLMVCPWLLNERYLNLTGASSVVEKGLRRAFFEWVANRMYFFYVTNRHSEHPSTRKKGNLRAVYQDFRLMFEADLISGVAVNEDQARAFWEMVADRVRFNLPQSDLEGGF